MNHTLHLLPLCYIIPILLAVAFLTLIERKTLGYTQLRKGPNILGPMGLLQPIADGIKLFIKEPVRPSSSSQTLFLLSPTMALTLAMIIWAPLPLPTPMAEMNLGVLFFLSMSSLMVYSVMSSGWASNSKYALMGALRAVSQTISYEITLALILLCAVLMSGGFSFNNFNITQEPAPLILPMWPIALMWFTSTLAETNRTPFDLAEGESELVSGFNVEYAGGPFALFFLAEYTNILMMNTISATIFLGLLPNKPQLYLPLLMMMKTALMSMSFLWARTTYPRFRYDQLMHLLWKTFLPLTIAILIWSIFLPPTLILNPPIT
uniref:NADH-ubiquinone oxidoreductase chain 1 n=1 Tax=Brachycephalus ephippium TaxID=164302 RepID=D3IZZ8_BRAEP|nr:NADH dehydrogenase 1 [Brachycephalus ephippium]